MARKKASFCNPEVMLYHLCHSYFQSCFLMPKGAQFLKPVKRKIFLSRFVLSCPDRIKPFFTTRAQPAKISIAKTALTDKPCGDELRRTITAINLFQSFHSKSVLDFTIPDKKQIIRRHATSPTPAGGLPMSTRHQCVFYLFRSSRETLCYNDYFQDFQKQS